MVEVLNHYLSEMSEAILDHGGTLVSYMGDGIMAVFGAPLEQPDHADRALAAAREMLGAAAAGFNEWMREAGLGDGFEMGIGLNSGEVMAGNVGSRAPRGVHGDRRHHQHRRAPRGDDEGPGHQLFISESTRAACRPRPDLVLVGDLEVRGRSEPIAVWGDAGASGS